MATKPTTPPPNWDSSNGNVTPIPNGHIVSGWDVNEVPPSGVFNWGWQNISAWWAYISDGVFTRNAGEANTFGGQGNGLAGTCAANAGDGWQGIGANSTSTGNGGNGLVGTSGTSTGGNPGHGVKGTAAN